VPCPPGQVQNIITINIFHLFYLIASTLYNSNHLQTTTQLSNKLLNYNLNHNFQSTFNPNNSTTTFTMAAFTLTFAPSTRSFGRSGYNKDGDDSETKPTNGRGRSGYNEPEEGDSGRSGYNSPDDDDNSGNKGRSGYNGPSDDDE
jgi:hypothetical protein